MIFAESCWKTSDVFFKKTSDFCFLYSESGYFCVFFQRSESKFSAPIDKEMFQLNSSTKLLVQFRCKEAWRITSMNPSPLRCWNRPVCKQPQPEKPLGFLRQTSNTGQKLNTQLKSMFKVPHFNVWTKLKTNTNKVWCHKDLQPLPTIFTSSRTYYWTFINYAKRAP